MNLAAALLVAVSALLLLFGLGVNLKRGNVQSRFGWVRYERSKHPLRYWTMIALRAAWIAAASYVIWIMLVT